MGLRLNIVTLSLLLNYYTVWVFVLPKVQKNSPIHDYFPDQHYAVWLPFLLSTVSVCTICTYFVWGIYIYLLGRRERTLVRNYESRNKLPIAKTLSEPPPNATPSPPAPIETIDPVTQPEATTKSVQSTDASLTDPVNDSKTADDITETDCSKD